MPPTFCDFSTFEGLVTIYATVPTGLEFTAVDEIKQKIQPEACEIGQGKVYFQTAVSRLCDIHQLRSVDRLFLVIKKFLDYKYDDDHDKAIVDLKALPNDLPWDEVVKFWQENLKHCKVLIKTRKNTSGVPVPSSNGISSLPDASCTDIRYRATASRVGKQQSVTSPDAELYFGGALQDITQWKVDLSNYNLEIVITLGVDFVLVGLVLTLESLHRRNITHFGYTTLRASIAYNMLRMCKILAGDAVVDPMCGTGVIPIEGQDEWINCFYFAGDKSDDAVKKSAANVAALNGETVRSCVEVLQWNVKKLPWRSASIDVCVTDLPFGKRVGSKSDNRVLYPSMLKEIARIARPGTARACLLTRDKRAINNAIAMLSSLWKLKRMSFINIGGLRAGVYLLLRTSTKLN
ncbi:tRNA (guanine(6)-N(2))-methyltransferase THUMP3-like [Clavelina lepadiformis]|uniref:tRNA (guanine(6)-N(2))-methyltransferase THUMP3-like n=1 Tax=Clavelina lepadiformis TaxID=159417 RepID=UPI004042393F